MRTARLRSARAPLWSPRRTPSLAAPFVGGVILGCGNAAPPSVVAPSSIEPVAASAAPVPSPTPSASSSAERSAPDTSDAACEATMFTDNAPGTLGLHVFEDASGRYGFADAEGRTVIAARFRFAYEFSSAGIAAAVDATGRSVFLDRTGAIVAEALRFDNGPDYFQSGRARIVEAGKVGFIDLRGRRVLAARWDGASAFCGDFAAICVGCKRGTGDDADVFEGGAWGAIDRDGREVVPVVHASMDEALARLPRAR